jgi:hypothetical protein
VIAGRPPASPLAIAASALRCASSPASSTTQAKAQPPSAITRPERIKSANLSPFRGSEPNLPSSMRYTCSE